MKIKYKCGKTEGLALCDDATLNSYRAFGQIVQHNKTEHKIKAPIKAEEMVCTNPNYE